LTNFFQPSTIILKIISKKRSSGCRFAV